MSALEVDPDLSHCSFAHHHLAGRTISEDSRSLPGRFVRLGKTLLRATALLGVKYQAALDEVEHSARALLLELLQVPDPAPGRPDWHIKKLYGEPTRP